jgi:hypothetical protein
VRYANRHLQLERQSHQPPARSTVQVFEDTMGQIEIRYRDHVMRYAEIPVERLAATRAMATAADESTPVAPTAGPLATPRRRRRGQQNADHPWHHAVTQRRGYLQFARDRRAWERVQP